MQQNIHRRWCLLVGQLVCKPARLKPWTSDKARLVCQSELPASLNNNGLSVSVRSYAHQIRASTPLYNERLLHTGNTGNWCKKEVDTIKAQVKEGDKAKAENGGQHMRSIAPTNFDKKILVWTGKYPSIDEVPPLVSDATLNWAKNKFRVYVNIGMAVATFGIALVVMYFGRRKAERGETVARMNMTRHPNQYKQHLGPQTEGSK